MLQLSADDRDLIAAAVTAAERTSDGEAVTIVAARSDAYHAVALHSPVLLMLFVPALWRFPPPSLSHFPPPPVLLSSLF